MFEERDVINVSKVSCSPKWTIFSLSRFVLLVDRDTLRDSSIHLDLVLFRAGLGSILGEKDAENASPSSACKKCNVPDHHFHLDFLHLRFREFDTFDTRVKSIFDRSVTLRFQHLTPFTKFTRIVMYIKERERSKVKKEK